MRSAPACAAFTAPTPTPRRGTIEGLHQPGKRKETRASAVPHPSTPAPYAPVDQAGERWGLGRVTDKPNDNAANLDLWERTLLTVLPHMLPDELRGQVLRGDLVPMIETTVARAALIAGGVVEAKIEMQRRLSDVEVDP